jgi:hypothetical protein
MRAPRAPSAIARIAFASFVLAFGVRLAWVLLVQSPFDAVYSDMAGYVERAKWLLQHELPGEPRILVSYPYGTHCLVALELLVSGANPRIPVAVIQALVGAIPAACMAALAVRLVPRRWAAVLVGGAVALWYPQVAFSGFFLSEVWFTAAIAVHAWLEAQEGDRAWRSLAIGAVSSLAFVVRPQFLLTFLLVTGSRAVVQTWRRGFAVAARRALLVGLPLALTIGASAVRLHRFSGHWGLIAENGLNRIWAETDVCEVHAHWIAPDGNDWNYWFSPPSETPCPKKRIERFEGYIGDPDILDGIRRKHLAGVTFRRRVQRVLRNVNLLINRNLPWPESAEKEKPPWRGVLQVWFAQLLRSIVLPLAGAGFLFGRRGTTRLVLAANLATPIIAAAFFFGEARYHVPYDAMAIVLAVAGAHVIATLAREVWMLQRRRRRERAARAARDRLVQA